jgi:hypothetical protein
MTLCQEIGAAGKAMHSTARMKKVPPTELSAARFVFFFQKHRQVGVDQEYRDVS